MANPKYSTTVRNTWLTDLGTAAGNAAILKLMGGTQPAGGATTETAAVTMTCGTPFFATVTGGVGTLTTVGNDVADVTTTITWARLRTSGGTWVADFQVTGTGGGGDLTMDNPSVTVTTTTVTPSAITITAPGG